MTSDERREIARRLRAAAKTKSNSADYLWNRLEIAVNGWRFGDDIDGSYVFDNDVLARLADLIDPTCEVEGSEPLYMDDETEFLLSCGHVADMVTDCPPAFCPECGARVVSDDDQ